ncbi:MAG: hypothetical protein JXL97_17810 [Bacteroidales bacterium]|nr:hypothetical protein [Bacteroidales bacterium]
MKRLLFILVLIFSINISFSQVHEIIYGDTTVMEQFIFFSFEEGLDEE